MSLTSTCCYGSNGPAASAGVTRLGNKNNLSIDGPGPTRFRGHSPHLCDALFIPNVL